MTEIIAELQNGGLNIPMFNVETLVNLILDQQWHRQCVIIIESDTPHVRPKVLVRFENGTKRPMFLRYSRGPQQGFWWEVCGDDMQSVENAIIAISKAPYPRNVTPMTFKNPLDEKKF